MFSLSSAALATGLFFWHDHQKHLHADKDRIQAAERGKPGVMALGSITPGEAIVSLTAPAASGESRIAKLLIHENDCVRSRQIVAVLDSEPRLKAALEQADAIHAAKIAALNKTLAGNSAFEVDAQRAHVEELAANYVQKQRDTDRYQSLLTDHAIAPADVETRQLASDTARKQFATAQQTLNQLQEVREVDVAVAKADVRTAEAGVQEAKAALEQAYVRAPVAGIVLKIKTFAGERVGSEGVLDLAPSAKTYAVAEVFETDATKVRMGQQAGITSAALPGELRGQVTRIGKQVERQQSVNTDPAANTDARIVRVWVELDPASAAAAQRFINLQVSVRFE